MKTFKRYLKENTEPVQGQLDSMGRPCVVISHTRRKSVTESEGKSSHLMDWVDKNDNAHISHHQHQIGEKLHKDQGESEPEHGNPRHEAIKTYTHDSRSLNKGLLEHHLRNEEPPEHFEDHTVAHMDAATNHHSLKTPLHVYSGTSFDVGAVAAKHPDRHIHLPAFTSTSTTKMTASSFSHLLPDEHGQNYTHHIIHFHLPVGHKGVYVGETHNENEFSSIPGEREFILPRKQTMKIGENPDVHHYNGTQFHIWHAHPVETK